jgi:hypothetical protein
MYNGSNIFAQVMAEFPRRAFAKIVSKYNGDANVKKFSCLDQFKVMAFAQLTGRESLRDTVACLSAMQDQLYHSGIAHKPRLNTLSFANENRDWRIYAELAQRLINTARPLYADEDFGTELADLALYALDASTIDLCLSLFPWAKFRATKSAIKLHTLMDMRGYIPTFIDITDGKVHDVNVLDTLPIEPGAIYVMDRGYLDFARLYALNMSKAYFVIRAKSNTQLSRRYSHPVDKSTGVQADQTVALIGAKSAHDYPESLRRVRYKDEESGRRFYYLTNHFELSSPVIAQLYKMRWRVELFFKWIKQHLRVKRFFGTNINAVKSQIWIAISSYLLVAILKKRLGLEQSLYRILQILSVAPFEKTPIFQLFSSPKAPQVLPSDEIQRKLW